MTGPNRWAEGNWWQEGVFYQIYPRSFADSNGDGVGDLRGIIQKLDYLEWLGVDGIWLTPTMASPNDDWGYDVSNYCSVHPELGTLEDLDELISESGRRNIKVLLDLVPNHTSTQHPWFQDALGSKDSRHRDWYVWADPKPDGSPPNNWLSVFGGNAWELDEDSGQYYLHNFLDTQADLNWWNEEVHAAFEEVLRFYFERGVAGFRIDVAHAIVKDKLLRDNPAATETDHPTIQLLGQRQTYNMDQPEVHDVIRAWRKIAEGFEPERVLVGETFLHDLARMVTYYGVGDELHLAFNIPFMFSEFDAAFLRAIVETTEGLLPETAWPVWTGSNHDVLRFPSRWCDGDGDEIRVALMMLLTLRGTPFLYYGDEIGMPDVQLTRSDLKDPVGERFWPENQGRDPGRTPMQWSAEPGAGFTEGSARPWLPLGDYDACNVGDQKQEPSSVLHLTHDLIALRRGLRDLRSGGYASLPSTDGTWVYRRGPDTVVALNLSGEPAVIDDVRGRIAIDTRRRRSGHEVNGRLSLDPWEGVVLMGRP